MITQDDIELDNGYQNSPFDSLSDEEFYYPDDEVFEFELEEPEYPEQQVPSWPELFGFPDGYVKCWTWTNKPENPYENT